MRTVRSAPGQPAAGQAAAGSPRTFTRSFHATADQVGDARLYPAGLRVEVEDEGGPWQRRPGPDDQCGRGLVIVGALASDWSMAGDGTSRTVWFELGSRPPASAG